MKYILFKPYFDDPGMSRSLYGEIQESAEELRRIMNEQTRAKFRERLQILYFDKVGTCGLRHACGFSPRFSRAGGGRGTNHCLQAPRPSGGGFIRRKAFQAGVYPLPAQPTGFSR